MGAARSVIGDLDSRESQVALTTTMSTEMAKTLVSSDPDDSPSGDHRVYPSSQIALDDEYHVDGIASHKISADALNDEYHIDDNAPHSISADAMDDEYHIDGKRSQATSDVDILVGVKPPQHASPGKSNRKPTSWGEAAYCYCILTFRS